MDLLNEFRKACPMRLQLTEHLCAGQQYKYFVHGKGCTLGVLFEDTLNIYFEWLEEHGAPVSYPAEIRYKCWSKRQFAHLIHTGVWEVSGAGAVAA